MSSARAILQLVRAPNLFTALADVLAGFLFVGGTVSELRTLGVLAFASVCFYAGGATLNDVVDAQRDARERPSRPIPSGTVSRRGAVILAVALLLGGLGLCALLHDAQRWLGSGLVVSIVLYDLVVKKTALAPAAMGTCRALNLLMGMSVVGMLTAAPNMIAAALIWLYVASVTHFARTEAAHSSPMRLRMGTLGVVLASVGLIGLSAFLEHPDMGFMLLVAVLVGRVAAGAIPALRTCAPNCVQQATKIFVQCLIIFDACLVFVARGPFAAAIVLALLLPTVLLSTRFRVT
ncbi:MAG: UbiA family prenyltransferase [Planctomycetes bacterium]|nr:UbiA family prenyltransferase [Planctomycetota bacterium]